MPKGHKKHHRGRSRRAMTSVHHVRRGLMSNRFWTAAAWLVGGAAIFRSVTKGDSANLQNTPAYSNGGALGKLQILAMTFIERITNGAISNQSVTTSGGTVGGLSSKPTWQLSNVLTSPFIWAGIAAEIYKRIPGLPARSKIGKFGLPLIVAGAAALLDDPSQPVAAPNSSLAVRAYQGATSMTGFASTQQTSVSFPSNGAV